MSGLTSGRPWLIALLAFGVTTMGPLPIAGAATVTAFEEPLFKSPSDRYASARVDARPGEANLLSIVLAGKPGNFLLEVRDDAESIEAGARCEGGGAAGATVRCPLTVVPGEVTVVLGNRGSTLDAGALPAPVDVWGGSGDDTVSTGDGDDQIFPTRCGPNLVQLVECDPELGDGSTGADRIATGAGGDWVRLGDGPSQVFTGPGNDGVLATDVPNGPDTLDLGAGKRDIASFYLRQTELSYTADRLANDGAPGEGDIVLDAEVFAGGNGEDRLVGDGGGDYLVGGGGSDLLIGQGGNDWLFGETGGGSRLNLVDGFTLNSFRYDYEKMRKLRLAAGGDRAWGGPGSDRLHLDGGDDRGLGGPGEDLIRGSIGQDRLYGQPGRNRIDGGAQRDRCRGGGRGSKIRHCES